MQTANGPVIISVVSTGDVPCYATSVNQCVETQASQDFLSQFVPLN